MIDRNIKIDFRPNAGIRIAPHFYTTDDEVREAIAAITDILENDGWQKFKENQDFVT